MTEIIVPKVHSIPLSAPHIHKEGGDAAGIAQLRTVVNVIHSNVSDVTRRTANLPTVQADIAVIKQSMARIEAILTSQERAIAELRALIVTASAPSAPASAPSAPASAPSAPASAPSAPIAPAEPAPSVASAEPVVAAPSAAAASAEHEPSDATAQTPLVTHSASPRDETSPFEIVSSGRSSDSDAHAPDLATVSEKKVARKKVTKKSKDVEIM